VSVGTCAAVRNPPHQRHAAQGSGGDIREFDAGPDPFLKTTATSANAFAKSRSRAASSARSMGVESTGCAAHWTSLAANNGPTTWPRTSGPPQRAHTVGGNVPEGFVSVRRDRRRRGLVGTGAVIERPRHSAVTRVWALNHPTETWEQRRYTWSLPSPEQREDFVGAEAGTHGDRYSPFPFDSPATYCLRGADGVG
jgi:hypothetical protein